MLVSFNCSVLSDTLNVLDTFSVNINEDNNKNIIVKLGITEYNFENLKVDHLRDYICIREKVVESDKYAVKLWKVDVIDESEIKEKPKEDEMKPRLLFKDYFHYELNNPADFKVTNIHVIAIIPATTVPRIINPFRDSNSILEWIQQYSPVTTRKPLMLVETFGARFTLCGRDDTIETLWNGSGIEQSNGILNRFKNFCSDRPKQDRNLHPIPFLACGPGTGKSRFLQELDNIIRKMALKSEDQDIKSILGNAVFLNVTYGNGSGASDFDMNIGAEASLALRILHAYFVNDNKDVTFTKFRDEIIGQENAKQLTLALVLRTICESKRKGDRNIKKIAIIVGIDEVNKVYDKDYDKFRDLVSTVGSMSCNPEMFFVPVLAGTVEGPLQSIITKSMHPPLQLPLHLLNMDDMLKIAFDLDFNKNFIYQNNLFRRMISDVGGQVRALELFYERISEVSRTHKWDDIDLVDIMISIEAVLYQRYPFNEYANMITQVLANAILERPVNEDETFGTDELKQPFSCKLLKSKGILTLEPTNTPGLHYIRLPYLWVRLLVKKAVNSSIKKFWHAMINPDEPFYWQDWEVFNVKFWALRYWLFSALGHKQIELKELLKGAHYSDNLNVNANVEISDHESVGTHNLLHRYPPSNTSNVIYDDKGRICNISLKDNSKVYKNGGGAKGDGFCFLITNGRPMLLSFQMKWREQDSVNPEKINDVLIKEEYEKSKKVAKEIGLNDNWILLILSNRERFYTKDQVPLNCAIVDKDNFNDFYGKIYSSRAQFFAAQDKVPINTARFCELRAIYGVGEKIASAIIKDRDNNKRKIDDYEDLCDRIPKFPRCSLGCIEY